MKHCKVGTAHDDLPVSRVIRPKLVLPPDTPRDVAPIEAQPDLDPTYRPSGKRAGYWRGVRSALLLVAPVPASSGDLARAVGARQEDLGAALQTFHKKGLLEQVTAGTPGSTRSGGGTWLLTEAGAALDLEVAP